MPRTRHVSGEVAFPAEAEPGTAVRITIELRDVSMQDQPAPVLASTTLNNVEVGAHRRVPFSLEAPAVANNRTLSMRIQVDMTPDQRHAPGDFLSTTAVNVQSQGNVDSLIVPVTRL